MNSRDMMAILDKARAFYPAFFEKKTDEALLEIAESWATLFARISTAVFANAFQATILSSKFFPTPSEVCEKLGATAKQAELTEQEAWGLVREAMKRGRSDNGAAWDSLPPQVQRAVGNAGVLRDWALMDAGTVNSVIASNFMRSYRMVTERQEAARPPLGLPSADRQQEAFALPGVDSTSAEYARLEALGAYGLVRFQKLYAAGLRGEEIPDEVRRAADEDLFRLEFAGAKTPAAGLPSALHSPQSHTDKDEASADLRSNLHSDTAYRESAASSLQGAMA